MTYEKAIEYLNSFLIFGSKLGLARMENLLQKLGNPQDRLKFIHVAGTNGKGSICAYTASILKQAGYKTGMFVSPYIIDFRERFQINGEMIEKAQLAKLTKQVKTVVDTLPKDLLPTEFELITAIGFLYFLEQGCDVVVLEVGIGGRLDATNVIPLPLCSVIASISMDHMDVLGDTIEKIAFEKAGIIKQGGKTVLYPPEKEGVLRVISEVAKERGNTLTLAGSDYEVTQKSIKGDTISYDGLTFRVPLLGQVQAQNAITAITAIKTSGLKVSDYDIVNGIENTYFPARCEVLSTSPVILLDGAHNPGGITTLGQVVKEHMKDPIGIVGMMRDKDVILNLKLLSGIFSQIITVPVADCMRTVPGEELCHLAKKHCRNVTCGTSVEEAIERALKTGKDFCICGSFYLCAAAGDAVAERI